MMPFGNLPGSVGPGLNLAADATAQEIGKALFLAGKIKCDCEVCRLLISAGTKVIKQLADTGGDPAAAALVPPDQPAADQSLGG
jgi:hypothetical protein